MLLSLMEVLHCMLTPSFQTHLTFGKEFTEAVEMKQVAQQEAERARFVVEKVGFTFYNINTTPDSAVDQRSSFLFCRAFNQAVFCFVWLER